MKRDDLVLELVAQSGERKRKLKLHPQNRILVPLSGICYYMRVATLVFYLRRRDSKCEKRIQEALAIN